VATESDKQIRNVLGGLSLILAGVGLVVLLKAALPDIVRYMKIRSM
jgi:hypothetical protein